MDNPNESNPEKPGNELARTGPGVSRWILGASALAMVAGGYVLSNTGGLFNYEQYVRPGYVRGSLAVAGEEGPAAVDALKAYMAKGEKVYGKCVGCHGPDGKGGPTYPSLAGSKWVQGETERFSMIIMNGLTGPAEDGKTYGVMPSQGIGMSPMDLAAVMTYVRNSFGNSVGDVVTVAMAGEAIKISEGRPNAGQPVTAAELEADHLKNLPGDPLDPTALVDPVTLQPAEK